MGRKLQLRMGERVEELRAEDLRGGSLADTEVLAVQGCQGLSEAAEAQALAGLLAETPRLRELDAARCSLTAATASELFRALRGTGGLQRLSLDRNCFGVEGATALADLALPRLPCLRELSLEGCRLDAVAARRLAGGLRQLSELEALSLGGNLFGAEGMRFLAEDALWSLRRLRRLSLAGFVRLDAAAAAHLAGGLAHLLALEELDLCHAGLDADAVAALVPGLQNLGSLQRLKISNSKLGVEGARVLAEQVLPQLHALQELWAARCNLDAAAMVELALGLPHVRSLGRLVLDGNEFGTEGAQALAAAAFPHLTGVTELDLSDCAIDAAATKELAPGLRHLRRLQRLRLRGSKFGTDGAGVLSAEALAHLLEMRVLDFRQCDFTRPAVEALAPGISQMADLEVLEFGERKPMGHFVRALSFGKEEWTPKLRKLKTLDLEDSGLGASFLAKLIPCFQYLRQLELVNFKGNDFGANGVELLVNQGLPQLGSLRDLNLTDCSIGSTAMQVLAPSVGKLAELEKLNFRGNEFGDTGSQALAESALSQLVKLKELVLAHCELDAVAIAALAPGIAQLTGLEKLVVAFNEFGEGGLEALCAVALPPLSSLKELNLCSCGLEGPMVAKHLAPALRHVLCLEKLVLTSNDLGEEAAKALATEALPQLGALRELELAHCFLDGAAARDLALSFKALSNLERLVLLGNNFGAEGAKALAGALPHLTKLTELNISYGGFNVEAVKELTPALKELRQLESLSVRNNKFGAEGTQVLASGAVQHLKGLKFLDLRLTGFTEGTVDSIAPCLARLSNLKSVELGEKLLLIAFVTALARCARGQGVLLSSFRELALDKCDLSPDILWDLAPGLRTLSRLEVLSLRGNEGIGVEGAQALASTFPALLYLRELHIAGCGINADAMKELVPGLAQLLDLEVLNLMNNQMGNAGAALLTEGALPQLLHLRELNVVGCGLDDEARDSIDAARCSGAGAFG